MGPHIRLGQTERRSSGHDKDSILADSMEALIGALYLEGGLEPVRALLRRALGSALDAEAEEVERDPKTRFQELVMARHGEFPTYVLLHDSEGEGDEARFTVAAEVLGDRVSEGVGRSKRAAEFAAATRALEHLEARAMDGDETPETSHDD